MKLEQKLAQARLQHTDKMIEKYINLYESGEVLSPMDVLHQVMWDEENKAADVISAAEKIMKYTMNKTPVEKQIELVDLTETPDPREELMKFMADNKISIIDVSTEGDD